MLLKTREYKAVPFAQSLKVGLAKLMFGWEPCASQREKRDLPFAEVFVSIHCWFCRDSMASGHVLRMFVPGGLSNWRVHSA